MTNSNNGSLPFSDDAEKAVLCSLILSPKEVGDLCASRLEPSAFYVPANRIVYELLLEFVKDGRPPEFPLLKQELLDRGQLEEIGGKEFLNELFGFITTAKAADYYIKIIREKYGLRRCKLLCDKLSGECQDRQAELPILLTKAQEQLTEICHSSNGDSPLTGDSLLSYSQREINSEDTLLGNRYLCRGGGMFIVAPSGIGKSVLAIQGAIEFAVGRASFGIRPAKPMRSLVVQAEDDDGDMIEMSQIIDHLKLNDDEKQLVERNTWAKFVNDLTGKEFLAALDGFLKQRPADLVWINPYSSYLGAEIKDDGANTLFLRNGLNPILTRHRCAAVIIHHTPKTNFRDTTAWKPSDWMYAGAGAAVLTNWARAIMVIDPTETPGTFRFVAPKRGQRSGWHSFETYWAHSREESKLLWVPADADQIAAAKKNAKASPDDLLTLIPVLDPVSQEKLLHAASEKGFGQKKTRDFLKILEEDGKVHRHRMPRQGVKSAVGYAKSPAPE